MAMLRAEKGGVAVEFGLAFPILILMVAAIMQLAFALWQAHSMLQAVSVGGRHAMVHYSPTCNASCLQSQVQSTVQNLIPYATVALPAVSCSDSTNWMTVTASHNVDVFSLPVLSIGTWSFSYRVPVGDC